MEEAILTELDTNLLFRVMVDKVPETVQNFSTVFVDEKEVNHPTISQKGGVIDVKLLKPTDRTSRFLERWYQSRKRINIMLEVNNSMYFMKGCFIKSFKDVDSDFVVFYNTYKKS